MLLQRSTFDLAGKLVLITGGSRGLGLVLARELAKRGAHLALCARDEDELARARMDLEKRGAARVSMHACDVTDARQVEQLVRTVEQDSGQPIDVLINNAGIIEVGPWELMAEEDFEVAMRLHFWAPLRLVRAVAGGMRQRGAGRIVNISSIGGLVSVPHLLPYCASKFALVGLSEGLRTELAKDGVLVTTVCPGLMRTGSPDHALFKGQNEKEYAWFATLDSLPFVSISAESAARQIVAALIAGKPWVIPSLAARVAALSHALAPSLVTKVSSLVARTLPGSPAQASKESVKGFDSHSRAAPSLLTRLTQRAAARNNETQRSA